MCKETVGSTTNFCVATVNGLAIRVACVRDIMIMMYRKLAKKYLPLHTKKVTL